MKNKNFFFKNKKGGTGLPLRFLILLILLLIVIAIVGYTSSETNQEAIQNVESMFEPYQETQCKLGYFKAPINCDKYSSICSDEEIEIWEAVRKKVEEFDCDTEECSCVETELLELVEGSPQDITSTIPSFNSFIVESKFQGEEIGDIEVYIQTSDGFLEFQYERNGRWEYRSPLQNEDTVNLQNLVQDTIGSSRSDGLGYILQEYQKQDSEIQELGVGLNVVYENINRVELVYQNEKPEMTYFLGPNKKLFSIKYENENYILNEGEDVFVYDNVEDVTCDKIILSRGDELFEFKNFDILCRTSFEDIDISSLNLESNTLPAEIKSTIEKLYNLNLKDNQKNAYEYLIEYSQEQEINPVLPLTVLIQESRGDPLALSFTGAAGLTQFVPNTARNYGLNVPQYQQSNMRCLRSNGEVIYSGTLSECNTCMTSQNNYPHNQCIYNGGSSRVLYSTVDERFDPEKSIEAGIRYLKELSNQYNNNLILILTAYNAGPSVANKCTNLNSENEIYQCVLEETNNQYKNSNNPNKVNEVTNYIAKITNNIEAFS